MISFDILNTGGKAEGSLIVWQDDGRDPVDFPDDVQDALLGDREAFDNLEPGKWITIADGVIVMVSEFHPFRISASGADIMFDGQHYSNLYIIEYPGEPADLPERLEGKVDPETLDAGEWIVVKDGEVETGFSKYPSHLEIKA